MANILVLAVCAHELKGRRTVHTTRERTLRGKVANDHNGFPAYMMFISGTYLRGSMANKLTLYFYVVGADRGAEPPPFNLVEHFQQSKSRQRPLAFKDHRTRIN